MQDWWQIAWVPFVTALIGWFTNWVALKMLFRPRRPVRLFGLRVQGLLPLRRLELARRGAVVFEQELLNQHIIRQELHRVDIAAVLESFARRFVRERLGRRLKSLPVFGGVVNAVTIGRLEQVAVDLLKDEAESIRLRVAEELEHRLQIRQMVEERIATFDVDRIEEVVMRTARREFRAIEIMGGVLGFLVGLGQLLMLGLTGSLSL